MRKVMKTQTNPQASSVGKKFVQMIGKAAISCSQLQGLGAAAVQDGLGKWDDLREFASIGKNGRWLSNSERDFHSKFRKLHGQWISTTPVVVPKLVRKTGLVAIRQAKVLYPHELWAHVSQDSQRFNEVFMPTDPEELRVFWQTVKDEVWMMEHPLRFQILASPMSCVPILIYGDEAPMGKLGKRLLRMGLWYSPFRKPKNVDGNMASHMDDISDALEVAIHRQQLSAIAWSFSVAVTNIWPFTSHDGTLLTPGDGHRYHMRGEPLNGQGRIPVVIGFTGDLQWDVKEFSPPFTWQTRPFTCNICHARHAMGAMSAFNVAEDADWSSSARNNTDPDWPGSANPLEGIPGAHRHSHFEDYVHEDLLGTRQLLNGGALRYACSRNWFGDFADITTWKERLQAQLDMCFLDFQQALPKMGIQCSQQKFTVAKLSLATSQHATAVCKGKAFNTQCVSMWLLGVFQEKQDIDLESQMICTALWGFCSLWDVAMDVKRRNSIICTDHEVDRLRVCRRGAFAALRWLASNAFAHNLSRFHLRPKFHQLDHCIRRSIRTGVIFSAFWVFQQEDSMGKWSKVGLKVHASVVSSRVIDRWLSLFLCTNKD